MVFRGIFLYLAASQGRSDTNNRDPEIGLEIRPEDTLEEVPFDDNKDIDDDKNEEVGYNATGDPLDSNNPRGLSSATGFTAFSKSFTLVEPPTWLQKVKYFVFPPKEDIESFIPNYRYIPIISGLLIPFAILLEIPGLTEHWYIRTENNQIIERRLNPAILDVGLGISFACAVIANICLITRFLEKRVKTMTILCATFLTIHDLINIAAVTVFGVEHRFNDGFTYGQSFWMTVCSTIASSFTNATLIWDLSRTPDFNRSGSGLTRRQRTLVIIIMVLFCYICVGALIISLIEKLSFIDGLYFTLVSIETIGFGDIVPTTTGSRLFLCVYSAIGILNLGVAIGMCRETVLEAMEVAYRKKAQKVKERWKEGRKRRRIETRWKRGIEWRLKEMGVPIWIRDENRNEHRPGGMSVNSQIRSTIIGRVAGWAGFTDRKIGHSYVMNGPTGMRLNLDALTRTQLEASALEAGVSLDTLLPSDIIPAAEETATHTDTGARPNTSEPRSWIHHPLASHFKNVFRPTQARTLTHARLGGMSALLTRFAVAAVHKHAVAPDKPFDAYVPSQLKGNTTNKIALSGETPNNFQAGPEPMAQVDKRHSHLDFNSTLPRSSDKLALQMMRDLDAKVFYSQLIIAWSLFFVFWAIGSAIFSATEGWSYGISMYFCFVAFTSIGYGDYHPETPAGRSVFVVWAILGVGTMTILISVIQEAYRSRYKSAMHIRAFDKAVKRYRQHVTPVSGNRGRRLHLTSVPEDPSLHSQGKARSVSCSSSVFNLSQAQAATDKRNKRISDSHTLAQESLEALPGHVLQHAKTFHTYIRLFVDDANILNSQNGGNGNPVASGGMAEVSGDLRKLLDEIAALGNIGKARKEEILQDPDARHTLFVLSIEKALHKMINVAEDAMEAVEERDKLACSSAVATTGPNQIFGLHGDSSVQDS